MGRESLSKPDTEAGPHNNFRLCQESWSIHPRSKGPAAPGPARENPSMRTSARLVYTGRSRRSVRDGCLYWSGPVASVAVLGCCTCQPGGGGDHLLAKLSQSVQHRPWPGTERSQSPPESGKVQARWCRLWVSSRPAELNLQPHMTRTWTGRFAPRFLSGSVTEHARS